MNGYGKLKISLTSALNKGEWSASRLGRFIAREIEPCIHWVRHRVGKSGSLENLQKNLKRLSGIEPYILGRPSSSLITILTKLHRLKFCGWTKCGVALISLHASHSLSITLRFLCLQLRSSSIWKEHKHKHKHCYPHFISKVRALLVCGSVNCSKK
jgi:hypothetical protein